MLLSDLMKEMKIDFLGTVWSCKSCDNFGFLGSTVHRMIGRQVNISVADEQNARAKVICASGTKSADILLGVAYQLLTVAEKETHNADL